ncbi:20808_t:CDS:2, partial [Racocetra persica]
MAEIKTSLEINEIKQKIKNLNLGQVSELIEALKTDYNITEETLVGPVSAQPNEPAKEKSSSVSLKFLGISEGANKIQIYNVIKNAVKELKGEDLNVIQASKLLQKDDKIILENIAREQAEKIKTDLAAKGLNHSPLFQDLPNKDFGEEQKLSFDNFLRQGLKKIFATYFPAEFSNYNNLIHCEVKEVRYEEPKNTANEARVNEKSFKLRKFDLREKIPGEKWEIKEKKKTTKKNETPERDKEIRITVEKTEQRENFLTAKVRCVGEKEINFCYLPKITPSGSFIVNGHNKVAVYQSVRAPAVYFFATEEKEIYGEIIPFKVLNFLDLLKTHDVSAETITQLFAPEDLNTENYAAATILEPGVNAPNFLFTKPNTYFTLGQLGRRKYNQKSLLSRQVVGQTLAEDLYDISGKLLLKKNTILEGKDYQKLSQALTQKKISPLTLPFSVNDLYVLQIKAPHNPEKIISVVGFGEELPETKIYFDLADLVCAVSLFFNLRYGLGNLEKEEEKDTLENQVIRRAGDLIYNLFENKMVQLRNENNSLSMLAYLRKLSLLGTGGFSSSNTTFAARNVKPSQINCLDLVDTPEGQNVGVVRNFTIQAKINDYGQPTAPYYPVEAGLISPKLIYLTNEEVKNKYVIHCNLKINENNQIQEEKVLARFQDDLVWVDASKINYIDTSFYQLNSVTSATIPFFQHNDATRMLMASNMQRQA